MNEPWLHTEYGGALISGYLARGWQRLRCSVCGKLTNAIRHPETPFWFVSHEECRERATAYLRAADAVTRLPVQPAPERGV